MNTTFGIIGGDKRQLYLAKSIMKDGYQVHVSGFELTSDTCGLSELPVRKLLEVCDTIILPLPATRDGISIYTPYGSEAVVADDEFVISLVNKNVFGGLMSKLVLGNDLWAMVNFNDYYLREELAVNNAIPTAEGALALAITEHEGIICGSECLVAGFGRIGKFLTKILLGMGANVTVAARKAKDLAMARGMGAKPARYKELQGSFDLIFNTVPELVITKPIIDQQEENTVMIELASLPGGIDRKAAALRGIRIVEGQSLPGKVAPKAAGEFIKEAIYNMLEE